MEKSGRSQGILEISVKVREFFKEEKWLDKVENPDASCFSRDAPYLRKEEKRIKNNNKFENLLVVKIFLSPTEPHTEILPASIL